MAAWHTPSKHAHNQTIVVSGCKFAGGSPVTRLSVLITCFWLGLLVGLLLNPVGASEQPQAPVTTLPPHEFYFTRGIYSEDFDDGDQSGGRWAVDYPKADRQFLVGLRRLSLVDAYADANAIELTDPQLRRRPFLYMLEVGSMQLDEVEIIALRDYLLAGGFLVIDDFWGSWAWENLVQQMQQVFPDRSIIDVPAEHPVFHVFYDIDKVLQVPNLRNGIDSESGGSTHEYDGIQPHVRGIFDDEGRLMVLINWNTDLGDAWEWADHPKYPLRFSTYAFKIGINFVIYAMTY